MGGYLPEYYRALEPEIDGVAVASTVRSWLQAEGEEFDDLNESIASLLSQFFVATASWALDTWESELGLPFNDSLTTAERRSRVLSRLRGYGTCDLALVKAVAASYDSGTIDIIEDQENYLIIVRFIDLVGVPTILTDLQKVLRATIPAHLGISYLMKYLIWSVLDGYGWDWDELDALTLTWDELEVHV